MDANKLEKLKAVGLRIRPCCALCLHGRAVRGKSDGWGTCSLHQYDHTTHTANPRQLSIHASCVCQDFALDEAALASLGEAWKQFFQFFDRETER